MKKVRGGIGLFICLTMDLALAGTLSAAGCAEPGTTIGSLEEAATVQRPISDFIDAQGTLSVFVPPSPDFLGWFSAINKPPVHLGSVDYAGVANEYLAAHGLDLGTRVSGHLSERPLGGGVDEITVDLHTTDALTFAQLGVDLNFATDPLVLGWHAHELLADPGRQPALSDSHFRAVFKLNHGERMPDMADDLFAPGATPPAGFELMTLSFDSNGTGPLHALAGLGPDGSRGRVIITQTGVLLNRGPNQGATLDGYPCEHVEVRAIGQ